jgi:hypothetical protein
VAREVWFRAAQSLQVNLKTPESSGTIEAWWMEEREKCRAKDRKWLDGLVCTVGYALWKNRNAEVFRSSARRRTPTIIAADIVEECKMLCHLWRAQRGAGVGDTV